MPRGSPKDSYANGKVYKLTATGTTDCYIGSTCEELVKRLYSHNWCAAHPETQKPTMACKLYEGGRKVTIELLEAVNCSTKAELLARERYWLENTPTAINRNCPGGRGWKENRERRKDEHEAYMAEYRSTFYTCECGREISKAEKARHERSKTHKNIMEGMASVIEHSV